MSTCPIYREQLQESERGPHTSKLFGIRFPLMVEPFAFDNAAALSEDYDGGHWEFFILSNGGFYMVPTGRESFHVVCANGYEGDLSADAFGIASCLYAYSLLSFAIDEEVASTCARQYHWLRDYAAQHPEAAAIWRATD
ncbi:antirestriction protein [Ramlibacter sp. AW1]|uniref:Antirestriction protein n=1 Tax=Ramlibacter aurantiacus TaxID=2801330 RepID=A0A936ZTQ4_9BURK|nr:antirestriction protein [Ramlibacter aurantiacus]MBL0422381.1 antirestriction protein [Ramlibacter aurantiacus]